MWLWHLTTWLDGEHGGDVKRSVRQIQQPWAVSVVGWETASSCGTENTLQIFGYEECIHCLSPFLTKLVLPIYKKKPVWHNNTLSYPF